MKSTSVCQAREIESWNSKTFDIDTDQLLTQPQAKPVDFFNNPLDPDPCAEFLCTGYWDLI